MWYAISSAATSQARRCSGVRRRNGHRHSASASSLAPHAVGGACGSNSVMASAGEQYSRPLDVRSVLRATGDFLQSDQMWNGGYAQLVSGQREQCRCSSGGGRLLADATLLLAAGTAFAGVGRTSGFADVSQGGEASYSIPLRPVAAIVGMVSGSPYGTAAGAAASTAGAPLNGLARKLRHL